MEVAASKPVLQVAAICGSLRKASFNRGLIRGAIQLCESGAVDGLWIEHISIDALPFLNTDLEVGGEFPAAVEAFRRSIRASDAVLIACPEYNYSISGPLKNAMDWASRPPNAWAAKPAAIVSAGGGYGGKLAQQHLRQVGVFLDLHFINKPEFTLNVFQSPKFDEEGNLIDEETKEKLKQVLLALQSFALKMKGSP
ncbi:NADPH:quinone oxidoreductase [Wolffia australiana]